MEQSLRICLRCQRIFRVKTLFAQHVRDEKTALARIKVYKTGKHHKEFVTAIEKSRVQTAELMPCEIKEQVELQGDQSNSVSPSQHRLLNRLLSIHAGPVAINLELLKKKCEEAGLPWLWVSQQIEVLIRAGRLVCPKPWQVHLVAKITPQPEVTSELSPTYLAQRLSEIIRKATTPVTLASLMVELGLEKEVSAQVEETLDQLMAQGFVFRTPKGRYRWIGD